MTDTTSAILLLRLQSTGSNTNLWGGYINTMFQTVERAAKGYQAYTVTGDATIAWTNYSAANDLAVAFAKFGGSPSSAWALTLPTYQTVLNSWNNSGVTGTLKNSGGTGIAIPTGRRSMVYGDGVDIAEASPNWLSSYASTLTNAGDIVVKSTLESAIATASLPATAGTILNSASDTTAGYLSGKTTVSIGTATTTQLGTLQSLQLSTDNAGGAEKLKITLAAPYVGGFLNGGAKTSEFIPVVGTAYDVDCTSSTVTVNLGGMTTPQLGQELKLNNFGSYPMYLKGTVNGASNMSVDIQQNALYRYCGSTWGWN